MTLVLEPGNHVIKNPTGRSTGSTVTNFTMISNGAMIVFDTKFTGSWTINSPTNGYAEVRGITFIRNSILYYAEISANYLQDVIFEDCNFHGIGIYMYDVDNAAFSRCNFSNFYDNYYGALYISYSLIGCISNTE